MKSRSLSTELNDKDVKEPTHENCLSSCFFLIRNVTSGYELNEPVHNLTIRINNFVPSAKLTDVEKQHEEEFLDSFFFFVSYLPLFYLHNDLSFNDGPHIRRWSIIL